MKINNYNVDPSKIFLRSSNNGISYKGFRRKRIGVWNKAKNWKGIPTCRRCGGFFGIDEEFHSFGINCCRTIEMCEWRGKRVSIDNDKICVSEYRVVATNEDIPDYIFNQCGYGVSKGDSYIKEISSGKWIIFGGRIGKITNGSQRFHNRSSAGNVRIIGGFQRFYNRSSAGKAKIIGGVQYFHDKSSLGNAKISGGNQYFNGKSLAGNAEISGGYQYFNNRSSAGSAKIIGGVQYFWDNSSIGNAKVSGGRQSLHN